MAFQRVAIVGLGLIGASLGLALHRLPRPPQVVGYDRARDAAGRASRRHAVDRVAPSATAAVAAADLVVLATPVRAVVPLLEELAPHLAPGAVVTDTGSTKEWVVAAAAERASHVPFVGGHPMAGKLTHGTDDADAALFDDAVYCLTPTAHTREGAIQRVVELIEAVGARPYFLAPAEHDGLVAGISHLPYLLASTLMAATSRDPAWREMAALAAGGFATMTRLVEAEPEMYADICLTNRASIVRWLDDFIAELGALRDAVGTGDETLRGRFATIRERHESWLRERASGPPSQLSTADLRGPSLLFPQSWQDALRGRRPPRQD